jgi:hypothetical protein
VIATTTTSDGTTDVDGDGFIDPAGSYIFPGLPAGDYTVWVNDTDNILGDLDQTVDPDATLDDQHTLTVDGTSIYDTVDFGYAPPGHDEGEGLIGDTIFLDQDSDNIADPGEGIEGVTVYLFSSESNTYLATATTDENGNYLFGGLDPDATYIVRVDETTLPNGGAGLTNTYDPDATAPLSESTVTLTPGDPINLDQDFGYSADTPGSVEGTIWNDTNADGTLDPGEPDRYDDVTVELLDSDGNIVATTTTEPDGTYSFPNIPPGDYTVDVTDENNVLDGTWHSVGTDSEPDPAPVTVVAAESTNADFGYYGVPASLGNFVWNDTNPDGIQDPGETGIAGIPVTLTITYPDASVVTLTTTTDGSGFYRFDNLLNDENYLSSDGTGTDGGPIYKLSIDIPTDYYLVTTDAGGDDTVDSDGVWTKEGDDILAVVTVGLDPNSSLLMGTYNQDYDIGFTSEPTAAFLLPTDFMATNAEGGIRLIWEYEDTQIQVFIIEKLIGDHWEQVSSVSYQYGGTYEWIDYNVEPGIEYSYQLVVFDSKEQRHEVGPVSHRLPLEDEMQQFFIPIITN